MELTIKRFLQLSTLLNKSESWIFLWEPHRVSVYRP